MVFQVADIVNRGFSRIAIAPADPAALTAGC